MNLHSDSLVFIGYLTYSLCTVGVESALYSLLLSLAICIAAVAVFTAHPLLLLPILLSILGMSYLCKH